MKLKSVDEFKKNIIKTHTFIKGLEANILATEALLEFTKAKSNPDYKKFKNILEFDYARKSYLYEVGFIALFSNFEFFMTKLLKELFIKFPQSFTNEKLFCIEEISNFKNLEEVREYVIDLYAIEKSYDIKSWLEYLNKKFNINIFKTKKHLNNFLMLNSLRNVYMHAGGLTNSRFRKEMKIFLKSNVPLNQKIDLDRKKFFEVLFFELTLIIKNIEMISINHS